MTIRGRVLLCGCVLFTTVTATEAVTVHVAGFSEVNQFSLPAGVPGALGDVLFSADGNTLFILGGSEGGSSGVWSVPVTRDLSGTVTGLGAATFFFGIPGMDTSLEFEPGTGTLFFRMTSGRVGQRRTDGTIATFTATGAAVFGGLAFVPDPLPNAGDLLVGDWSSGVINSHSLVDNLDATFTPMLQGFYSNSQSGATGDLHFIPTGAFAGDLMFTNWSNGTVSIIDIDPVTGFPVGGGGAPSITLLVSGLGSGPWGLDFDPITRNLFISNFGGSPSNGIIQISGFPPSFQPSHVLLATGSDSGVDGFLDIAPNEYGEWSIPSFSTSLLDGDRFRPCSQPLLAPSFSTLFFLFGPGGQREALSDNNFHGVVSALDTSLSTTITAPLVASDTNFDVVDDTATSSFRVFGGGTVLDFDLLQSVAALGPGQSRMTQTYTITNAATSPITFTLVRHIDGDLVWDGTILNDEVGTNTNSGGGDLSVFMQDPSFPGITRLELSSAQGRDYYGVKSTQPVAAPGSPPGAGTTFDVWDAFGIPTGWNNFIANVGTGIDGSSAGINGDASIGMDFGVSLGSGESTTLTLVYTYGEETIPPPPCDLDLTAAQADFLELSPGSFVVTEGETIVVPFTSTLTAPSSLTGLPGALLCTSVPDPADEVTEIRFSVLHAECGSGTTFDFSINGTGVGSFGHSVGCTCNDTPLVVTLTNPADLALAGGIGCSGVAMDLIDPVGGLFLAIIRAEIDRSLSGTETVCLFDSVSGGGCADRDICPGPLVQPGTSSYAAPTPAGSGVVIWTPTAADKDDAPYTATITVDNGCVASSCVFTIVDVNLRPDCSGTTGAGSTLTFECDVAGGALVTLNGVATDLDDDDTLLMFHWDVSDATVVLDDPNIADPTGVFPIGMTMATLTVTDGRGGVDICDVMIEVQDTTPPEVLCTTSVASLWPPKHKMVEVSIIVAPTDACAEPEFIFPLFIFVSSDEPDNANGVGDGNTTGDVNGQDGFSAPVDILGQMTWDATALVYTGTILLRAERDGTQDGRKYTIDVTALDSQNNPAITSCCVVVPHDRRGGQGNNN